MIKQNTIACARRLVALLVAFAFLALCVWLSMLIANPAHARDPDGKYASSPHAQWFKSQHNSLNEWCCDESDAHRYYGDYTVNADGSVTVEGETIPAARVLNGANPTGSAVWWFMDFSGGRRTYCFAPGSGA